ncbi:hypothetical protein Ancab_010345 [Ancistrocladus abbreviatus]
MCPYYWLLFCLTVWHLVLPLGEWIGNGPFNQDLLPFYPCLVLSLWRTFPTNPGPAIIPLVFPRQLLTLVHEVAGRTCEVDNISTRTSQSCDDTISLKYVLNFMEACYFRQIYNSDVSKFLYLRTILTLIFF